ncbi:hypothetical protein H312_02035 [Anncaliia algerae PRA339]|uniref:Uncharacterized protein n=1 Tax=Anncaliia algerae PRA339 TaxID=1288291 RepID=A0A059F0Q5_9MICR|nr:hypothetical protein H312_02035 [Anncaliia algerae PRA339]
MVYFYKINDMLIFLTNENTFKFLLITSTDIKKCRESNYVFIYFNSQWKYK